MQTNAAFKITNQTCSDGSDTNGLRESQFVCVENSHVQIASVFNMCIVPVFIILLSLSSMCVGDGAVIRGRHRRLFCCHTNSIGIVYASIRS